MSEKSDLSNIKKLREITGVGFKDCKSALDENNGDIEKSIEFLRKKGIAKASKKMSRVASDGLVTIAEKSGEMAIIEINSETDFVAKNEDFINFCKEISRLNLTVKSDLNKLTNVKMQNNLAVAESLIGLISKIGEKITIRRSKFFDNKYGQNYFYIHSGINDISGKIISVVKLKGPKKDTDKIGQKIAMHIAATSPLSIDKNGLNNEILKKEREIIIEELRNEGKKEEMIKKISEGKINKFISENTLLSQVWIMDPKKKVKDIIDENSTKDKIIINDFARFKVGEGL